MSFQGPYYEDPEGYCFLCCVRKVVWFRKTRGGTSILTKCVTVLAATIRVMRELMLSHTVIN